MAGLERLGEADCWNKQLQRVAEQAERMLRTVLEFEAGVRGALLAGDDKVLATYKTGGADAFTPAWERTRALAGSDAEHQRRLDAMKARNAEFKAATLKLVRMQASLQRSIG